MAALLKHLRGKIVLPAIGYADDLLGKINFVVRDSKIKILARNGGSLLYGC
jgi:hypothetical protein